MANDSNLIQVLAIARLHGFDFLCHLNDDCARWRISKFDPETPDVAYAMEDWCDPNKHSHFEQLKDEKVMVWDVADSQSTRCEVSYQNLIKTYVLHFCYVCHVDEMQP